MALQGGVAGLQGQARRRGRGAGAVRPDAMAAVAVGASLDARFLAAMGCGAAEERASGARFPGPEGFEGVDGGSACATGGRDASARSPPPDQAGGRLRVNQAICFSNASRPARVSARTAWISFRRRLPLVMSRPAGARPTVRCPG